MAVACCLVRIAAVVALGLPALSARAQGAAAPAPAPAAPPAGAIDFSYSEPEQPAAAAAAAAGPKATRWTLAHESSMRLGTPSDLVNNRSSARVEYSKFFLDRLFAQLDWKLIGYWSNDHRAAAEGRKLLLENSVPEAFLQYSAQGGRTSLRAGVQRLIWGESEAGAITDEVSPRNLSELFLIPLEESRIGQFMFNVDHYSTLGNWELFFVPAARFNKLPGPGTRYDFSLPAGLADIRDDAAGRHRHEAGLRWKKTFGRSDVSLMAASLVDNDRPLRAQGITDDGRLQLRRQDQRFSMAGLAFNLAQGKALFKGELAWKSPKAFNTESFELLRRDVVDSSIGVTWSLAGSWTVGAEFVNSHVLGWTGSIAGVPRNSSSIVLNASMLFMDDNLSVNWLAVAARPYASLQSSIRSAYKWSDNVSFGVDLHLIRTRDPRSGLYRFRDQDQLVLKGQFQF